MLELGLLVGLVRLFVIIKVLVPSIKQVLEQIKDLEMQLVAGPRLLHPEHTRQVPDAGFRFRYQDEHLHPVCIDSIVLVILAWR